MKKQLPSLEDSISIDSQGAKKLNSSTFQSMNTAHVNEDQIIIGVDEVGRGSVFGPMIVCACANLTGWRLGAVRDSKEIKNENMRRSLANEIRHNLLWATATIDAAVINRFGTRNALVRAGQLVAQDLVKLIHVGRPDQKLKIIYDGRDHPSSITDLVEIVSIEKADATIFEVSCASIVAKSTHDGMIQRFVRTDPAFAQYDLLSNRGYGTVKHREALVQLGMTSEHRVVACTTLLTDKKNAKTRQVAPAKRCA